MKEEFSWIWWQSGGLAKQKVAGYDRRESLAHLDITPEVFHEVRNAIRERAQGLGNTEVGWTF